MSLNNRNHQSNRDLPNNPSNLQQPCEDVVLTHRLNTNFFHALSEAYSPDCILDLTTKYFSLLDKSHNNHEAKEHCFKSLNEKLLKHRLTDSTTLVFGHKEYILHHFFYFKNKSILQHAQQSTLNDIDFLTKIANYDYSKFKHFPPEVTANKELIISILNNNCDAWIFIDLPEEIRSEKTIASLALTHHGLMLSSIGESLKEDTELYILALQHGADFFSIKSTNPKLCQTCNLLENDTNLDMQAKILKLQTSIKQKTSILSILPIKGSMAQRQKV